MIREPDGTLRKGNADERHSVNQIYFPQSGRELKHPVMFQDENLQVTIYIFSFMTLIYKYNLLIYHCSLYSKMVNMSLY